ncbi:MAG: ABC transporter substrate binding protein [Betaproteobacteria bacterium]
MNTQRSLFLAIGAGLIAPLACFAQQPTKTNRVGFLLAESASGQAMRLEALRAGLRDLGYVEGKNILIELRSAEGYYDRLPVLAAELVRLKVDVLVAFGAKAVAASRHATTTIPIIVPSIGDPVASGLVGSFASLGGNIVGSDNMNREVYAKRFELLREVLPRAGRIGSIINPAQTTSSF